MANIKDVARLAGVSAGTVSRALSGKVPVNHNTRARVLAAVAELGYKPNLVAQGLKFGRSKTIGILVPNIRNLIFPEAIRGISDLVVGQGYSVVLADTDEDLVKEQGIIENLRRRLVDGLVMFTATEGSENIINLNLTGFPVVLALRNLANRVNAVIADNYQGGYQGGKFLLQRGYRRIALINGTLELELYRQRFQGFAAAMQEGGVPTDQELICHGVSGWEDSLRRMTALLDQGLLPQAVFATSDSKALGVIRALRNRGLAVPGDVSVLGFDNLDISAVSEPPLTTISQPFYELGRRAAQRLLELMSGEYPPGQMVEVLPIDLMVRESVGFLERGGESIE